MTVRRAIACMALAAAVGSLGAARASAQEPGLRYFGYFAARITAAGGNHLAEVSARSNLNYLHLAESDPRVIGLLAFGFWTSGYDSADLPQTVAAHADIFNRIAPRVGDPGPTVEIAGRRARINRHGVARVRLRCPATSAEPCAGELALQRKHPRTTLGWAGFELAPSSKAKVRVRVSRRRRHRLVKQSGRGDGVKIRAAATSAAGSVGKTLTLRLRSRRR